MSEQQADDAARVAEIRQRAEAATDGPWAWGECRDSTKGILVNGAYPDRRPMSELFNDQRWVIAIDTMTTPLDPEENCGETSFREDVMVLDRQDAEFIAHSREDIPYLLSCLDALRAELEASRAREAALEAALGHAVEAVQFLLDEDWPQTCDPGPGIRTDLTRWQALLAGRAVPEDA